MNDEKDTSFGHQAAYDILYRLYVVLKIAKIHDSNNANFQDQVQALMGALKDPLHRQGRILIQVRRNAFFINFNRVRFHYSDFHINKSLLAEFARREIGTLTMSRRTRHDRVVAAHRPPHRTGSPRQSVFR